VEKWALQKRINKSPEIIDHFGLKTYLADDVIPVKESNLNNS
jgi:hypothetical protein